MISSKKRFIIVVMIFYTFFDEVCHADFVVVTEKQIIFFSNGTTNTTVDTGLDTMTAAAYDPIKKHIYVCDSFEKIFRVRRRTTRKTKNYVTELVVDKQAEIVIGLAYDHKNFTLYWRTYNGIYFVCVTYDEITDPLIRQSWLTSDVAYSPDGLAIDVHGGYLYWVNFDIGTRSATIERSRLDKSGRKVVVERLTNPQDIAVNVEGNTLYWINCCGKRGRSIDSADLPGNGTWRTLVHATETRKPNVIALDDQYVYWIDFVSGELWMAPKNSSRLNVSPTKVSKIEMIPALPIGLFLV